MPLQLSLQGPETRKFYPHSPGLLAPHPPRWLLSLPSSAPGLSLAEGRSGQVSVVSHTCDHQDPRPEGQSPESH